MVPEHRKYSPTHEWCAVEGDLTTVGVTKYVLKGLGSLISVELPDVGDDVLCDVPFGGIEGLREVKDVHSPVDGIVVEVNHRVENDPNILERDPYNDGWLIRLKVDEAALRSSLLSAAEYQKLVRSKSSR